MFQIMSWRTNSQRCRQPRRLSFKPLLGDVRDENLEEFYEFKKWDLDVILLDHDQIHDCGDLVTILTIYSNVKK